MSAPAQFAEALARRRTALQACSDTFAATQRNLYAPFTLVALTTVAREEDQNARAARATANAVANHLLAYHCVPFPPSKDLPAILSAIHRPSFAHLAELADSLGYAIPMILALRHAHRAHHEQEDHDPIPLDSAASDRILACATLGDVAKILEDELHVPDATFESTCLVWRDRDTGNEGTGDYPYWGPYTNRLQSAPAFEPCNARPRCILANTGIEDSLPPILLAGSSPEPSPPQCTIHHQHWQIDSFLTLTLDVTSDTDSSISFPSVIAAHVDSFDVEGSVGGFVCSSGSRGSSRASLLRSPPSFEGRNTAYAARPSFFSSRLVSVWWHPWRGLLLWTSIGCFLTVGAGRSAMRAGSSAGAGAGNAGELGVRLAAEAIAGVEERGGCIADAICARGAEIMMMHDSLERAAPPGRPNAVSKSPLAPRNACGAFFSFFLPLVALNAGRASRRDCVVNLATNCPGCHVLQKALDCEEEEVRLFMGERSLTGLRRTLSKLHSHPARVGESRGEREGRHRAAAVGAVFGEVGKSQWCSYSNQPYLFEYESGKHRQMNHLLMGLLEFVTNEQGSKSVVKALKVGGKETLDRVVQRMYEPAKGACRAMIVDLALYGSVTGS
ncbi:hypothetical protein C8R45DRAFT_1072343 [Mycena sanguinolenta]|nr:hypothetical protein C8R45DRAFT_1072343 [Mycena sanguinolenta]